MSGLTDRECMLDAGCKIKAIQTFVDAVNPDIIYSIRGNKSIDGKELHNILW